MVHSHRRSDRGVPVTARYRYLISAGAHDSGLGKSYERQSRRVVGELLACRMVTGRFGRPTWKIPRQQGKERAV